MYIVTALMHQENSDDTFYEAKYTLNGYLERWI